jgi:Ca-activated chloride channel family protein
MTFLWPEFLWGLAGLPFLVFLYVFILKRKQRAALRYSSLSLLQSAGKATSFRRHLPPLLFLIALGGLIAAAARPTAVVTLPSSHETEIMAKDVSGSMRATDVQPNRLAASQAAARQFILDQPENVRVGIVAFAGSATLAQAPTRNREDAIAAIDRFQLQRATAIGSAIIVALATIFPDHGLDVASFSYGIRSWRQPPPPQWKPVPAGSYNNAVIILLTDGQRTTGPDSMVAAKLAAERGVRIYTVGFGTPAGEVIGFEGWSMRVRLDEDTLKGVADLTRGEYFFAGSAPDLKKVYETLRSRISFETKRTEVTALVALGAAALALLSAVLSLVWFHRIF